MTRPGGPPTWTTLATPPSPALAAWGVGLALVGVTGVIAFLARKALLRAVETRAESLEFLWWPGAEVALTAACWLAPLAALAAVLALGGRRVARARVGLDHVVVQPLELPWPTLVVPLADVERRRDAPGGVELVAPAAVPRLLAALLPPLVPAPTEADRVAVHALLDAGGPRPAPATGGHVGRGGATLALVALTVLLGAAAVALSGVVDVLPFCCACAVLLAGLAVLVAPHRARVSLARDTAAVGGLCVPWAEVTRVAADGAWFALEAGGRRRAARVGREAAARLADAARARGPLRLAADGRPEEVVCAGRPPWLRRRRATAATFTALAALLVLRLGPVEWLTAEGHVVALPDHHGQALLVNVRRHDGTPTLVVLTEGGPWRIAARAAGAFAPWAHADLSADGRRRHDALQRPWLSALGFEADIVVDAEAGRVTAFGEEHAIPRGATVVHVRRDGVRASNDAVTFPTWPRGRFHGHWEPEDALSFLVGATNPQLARLAGGEEGVRCWESYGLPRVTLQVVAGRVTSLAVSDRPVAKVRGCFACAWAEAYPGRAVRLVGDVMAEADLPELVRLRPAIAAIERQPLMATAAVAAVDSVVRWRPAAWISAPR